MARGRVFTRRERGSRWLLMVAEVHDAEGRLVWTDNTRFAVRPHALMVAATAEVVDAVRTLERLGHRLEWDWRGCEERAPKL